MAYPATTFETKCWEGDWRYMLFTDHILKNISRCNHSFDYKVLLINNVSDPAEVIRAANALVLKGVLTSFHLVSDYADAALKFFNLSKSDLGIGYVYSIAELVGIYLCQTEYLVHFSGDSMLLSRASADWVTSSINLMETYPHVKTAALRWSFKGAKAESFNEDDNFFIGSGFSDQNYLIKIRDFKDDIYRSRHFMSERYPGYGGELFEKRVDSWLRTNHYLRAMWKHDAYSHACYDDVRVDSPKRASFLAKVCSRIKHSLRFIWN